MAPDRPTDHRRLDDAALAAAPGLVASNVLMPMSTGSGSS